MAQLMQAFDATKFDPSQGLPQMPVGKHPVVIVNDEIKPTKDNSGGYLELTLQIIDGPAKGQQGAYRLNLYNQSQQAVEIAHRQFSAICHAVGVFQVTDGRQLHNIPFMVEVGLQKDPEAAQKGFTEVKRIFDRNGNEPGKAGSGAPAAQPAQQQPTQQQPAWGQPAGGQPAQSAQQPPQGGGQPAWGQPAGQPAQPAQQPNQGGWGQPAGQPGNAAPAGNQAPWAR